MGFSRRSLKHIPNFQFFSEVFGALMSVCMYMRVHVCNAPDRKYFSWNCDKEAVDAAHVPLVPTDDGLARWSRTPLNNALLKLPIVNTVFLF